MSRRLKSLSGITSQQSMQDQVNFLSAENARLREIIVQHGLENELNEKGTSVDGAQRLNSNEKLLSNDNLAAVASTVSPKSLRLGAKGCKCKGKCATRKCGCIKKEFGCNQYCKCNKDVCGNQDSNKENMPNAEALKEEDEENLQRLKQLSLEGKLQSKQARVQVVQKHPGLFSPAPSNSQRGFNVADFPSEPLSFGNSENDMSDDEVFLQESIPVGKIKKKSLRKPTKKKEQVAKAPSRENKLLSYQEEETEEENKAVTVKDEKFCINHDSTSSDEIINKDVPNMVVNPFEKKELEDIEDPMKPRPKLARSPIVPRSDYQRSMLLDISELPLPAPPSEERVETPPVPEEFNEPNVDWEKHQAERVHCRKCGRGFYPHRIKKHEASCQKI